MAGGSLEFRFDSFRIAETVDLVANICKLSHPLTLSFFRIAVPFYYFAGQTSSGNCNLLDITKFAKNMRKARMNKLP